MISVSGRRGRSHLFGVHESAQQSLGLLANSHEAVLTAPATPLS